eukprot:7025850-Pyramimonas_sp.AAC.1
MGALDTLRHENVNENSILYPIAGVASFKGLVAMLAEVNKDKLKMLTRSQVVKIAKAALVQLDVFESDSGALNSFKAAMARATSHANTVKVTHRDRGAYSELLGCLIDKVDSAIK